jgi:hypothetical protein
MKRLTDWYFNSLKKTNIDSFFGFDHDKRNGHLLHEL